MNKTNVKLVEDSRCLNKPAWSNSSLRQKSVCPSLGTRIADTDEIIEPLSLPVFAYIRTVKAVYDRVKIIHESRDEFRITFKKCNRRGVAEVETETIEKQHVRTIRLYVD